MTVWIGQSQLSAARANLDNVLDLYLDAREFGVDPVSAAAQDIGLSAALAAAATIGGKVILTRMVPVASQVVVPPNVILEGAGGHAGLKLVNGSTLNTSIVLLSSSQSKLRNIQLDGNKANAVSGNCAGVLTTADFTSMEDVQVYNMTGPGFRFAGPRYFHGSKLQSYTNNQQGFVGNCLDSQFIGLLAWFNGGVGIEVSNNSQNVQYSSVNAEANLADGILVTGRNSFDIKFFGFASYSNQGVGLELWDTDWCEFVGGLIALNYDNGIALESSRFNNFSGMCLRSNSQRTNGGDEEIFIGDDGAATIFSKDNSFAGTSIVMGPIKKANYAIRENVGCGPTYVTGGKIEPGTAGTVSFQHPSSRTVGVGGTRDTEDPITSISANYTATGADYYIRVTTGTGVVTVTLPNPTNLRFSVIVMKADAAAGTVNVVSAGAKTLNGAASVSIIDQYKSALFISNGTNYDVA